VEQWRLITNYDNATRKKLAQEQINAAVHNGPTLSRKALQSLSLSFSADRSSDISCLSSSQRIWRSLYADKTCKERSMHEN
jgi:hypothetical protein